MHFIYFFQDIGTVFLSELHKSYAQSRQHQFPDVFLLKSFVRPKPLASERFSRAAHVFKYCFFYSDVCWLPTAQCIYLQQSFRCVGATRGYVYMYNVHTLL